MPERIVVAVRGDDDGSRDALALGIALARPVRAELVLGAVWSAPLGPGAAGYERALRSELEQRVGALVAAVPSDLAVRPRLLGATSIVHGLHQIVELEEASTLVLGPSHLPRALRAVRGDVALSAMRDAPCAIAIAPEGYRDANAGPLRHLVVGWDGSDEAAAALERAVQLAARAQPPGELRLVHTVELPHELARRGSPHATLVRELLDDLTAAAQSSLEQARAQVAARVPLRCEIAEGVASDELARFGEGADLVVTGSRRYGPLRRLVLGSTTARLLQQSEAPVLVLPRGIGAPGASATAATAAGTVTS